jgi:hypothetical protein
MFDYLTFMSTYLKIISMYGDVVYLNCNPAQLMVHKTLQMQHEKGLPVRAIVLKARREGVSTYTEGRFFCDVNRLPNRYACVCSADLDATNKVFKMARMFQDNMPTYAQTKTKYSSRKEIVYDEPHMSEFLCQTSGKGVLGRGGLTHYLHLTEFAFWDRAKEQFGGAAQEVPDSKDTAIIIESTANGVGDAFHDIFWQALDDWEQTGDLNNYLPIFLPWFIFPDYQRPVTGNFKLDDEEDEILHKFKLNLEQMAWRRWAIKNKCQGDDDLFKQEYPATPVEAFRHAGNPIFPAGMLQQQEKHLSDVQYGVFSHRNGIAEWEPVDRRVNCWQVSSLSQNGQFTIGCDTMEGKSVDISNQKAKIDRHGMAVFNRSGEFVAAYRGTGDQVDVAEQLIAAGIYYNQAQIAPEVPNGMVVLQKLKEYGYPNIYNRQTHDETLSVENSDNLGWRTTSITRKWLVDGFLQSLRDNIKIRLPWIFEEMTTFIRDKMGKPVHNTNKHDDVLFGAMIAVQLHLRCPMTEIYPFETTGEEEPRKQDFNHLARIGAIDTGDDEWDY